MDMQRILRAAPATLSFTVLDADGEPVEAAGAVTVEVVDHTGAVVLAAGTATTRPGPVLTGVYQAAISPCPELTILTATWSAAGQEWTSQHEVVGAFAFSAQAAYQIEPSINGTTDVPAIVHDVRTEVEAEAERLCARSFTPRFRQVTLDGQGTGTLALPVNDISRIRSVTISGSSVPTSSFFVVDDGYRNQIGSDRLVFPSGRANVTVAVEYGLPGPDADMRRAMITRLRSRLNANRSGIPERATSFVAGQNGTFRLAMPDEMSTGYPEIDAVYRRYSLRSKGSGDRPAPASRAMNLDPQYHSVFNGGVR